VADITAGFAAAKEAFGRIDVVRQLLCIFFIFSSVFDRFSTMLDMVSSPKLKVPVTTKLETYSRLAEVLVLKFSC
jgi:hypothetical protein